LARHSGLCNHFTRWRRKLGDLCRQLWH